MGPGRERKGRLTQAMNRTYPGPTVGLRTGSEGVIMHVKSIKEKIDTEIQHEASSYQARVIRGSSREKARAVQHLQAHLAGGGGGGGGGDEQVNTGWICSHKKHTTLTSPGQNGGFFANAKPRRALDGSTNSAE
jgi:hypothetical protein